MGDLSSSVPITHFPHPDVVKVAVRKAIDDAHWLYVEAYGEKDNKNTTCTIEPQLPTNQQAVRDLSSPVVLKVGSDCSGMETYLMALSNFGMKYDHVFSSDSDPKIREFIRENFKPKVLFDDVRQRNNRALQKGMDLYVAGFPCQPFSIAGHQKGFDDERGKIVSYGRRHIHQI